MVQQERERLLEFAYPDAPGASAEVHRHYRERNGLAESAIPRCSRVDVCGIPVDAVEVDGAVHSHDPPRRAGKPSTGQRGIGDRISEDREVCVMQSAETVLDILNHWRARCGETRTPGSGGGRWKRAERHLASVL